MKKVFFFIILSSFFTLSFAQPWKGNNAFLENYLKTIKYDQLKNDDFVLYRVPLKFWIYTKSDGSGNATPDQIKDFMTNLNYFHQINKTGFRFYLADVQYIQNDKHNELGYYREAPRLSRKNKQAGLINIHIARNIKKGHGTVRGTYNMVTKSVLIKQYTSKSSLAHEIGHYFGLKHTHRNYDKGKSKQEPVSRTRKNKKGERLCEVNGDKLCDTPAEPRLSKCVNRNCEYTGEFRDQWGDLYKPDPTNIMGYPAYRKCRTKFTRGQIAVMLYTASKDKNVNYWRTSINGKPYNMQHKADAYEPDALPKTASRIMNNETQYHSFNCFFAGVNQKDKLDKTDYIWFRLKNRGKSKVELNFTKASSIMSDMEIAVYDKSHTLIVKKRFSKRMKDTLPLNRLKLGDYFVEIKNMGSDRFSDYNVELINH